MIRRFAFHVLAVALACLAQPAFAQDQADEAAEGGLHIKPVLLDSEDGDGATLGLEYELSGTWWETTLSGGTGIDPDATIASAKLNYEGSGTFASSADRNPKNFLDLQVSFDGEYSAADLGTFTGGFLVKLEADQTFDSEQRILGGHVTYGKRGILGDNDAFAIDLNYGKVDPVEDELRKAALGVTELESFNRTELEVLYMFRLPGTVVESIELNYRRYDELDAPAAIEAAGLDSHELSTILVNLPNDLFVAYSTGKLPFDLEDDQIFEIGFSYKLF